MWWSGSASAHEKFVSTGNLSYLYEMEPFDLFIVTAYFAVLCLLSFYGIHRYLMVYLFFRNGHIVHQPLRRFETFPRVTVQVPAFNEMYVIERVIDAVCQLDYPRDRMQVQVLDDSTDETHALARNAVKRWRARGVDANYIHREHRSGFKAGALANGLRMATGEFIAVFDVDFLPERDFLHRAVHHFTDPRVGMVQGRWVHLNRSYSFLTKVQAMFLDAHFMLESFTRSVSGRFFNFNGTAGMLRRQMIDDAGGWQHDTLTEDLDLSYRAQIKGWKFVFLPNLRVPAELPVEMNSFKSQQCRWAKGAIQTAKKVLPAILKSDLSAAQKLESWYHLTGCLTYPLMILLSMLLFPALIVRFNQGWFELLIIDLPLFLLAFSSVSCFYITSQKILHEDWYRRIAYLPGLMALGIGMTVCGSKAVVEGLFGIQSPFARTPKFSVEGANGEWRSKKYRVSVGALPFVEVGLGIYFTLVCQYALQLGVYGIVPFLLLFQFGYLYTGLRSLARQGCGWGKLAPLARFLLAARPRFLRSRAE